MSPISTESELRQAQQLAIAAFPTSRSSDAYKQILWENEPSFHPRNVFVLSEGGQVRAVIRIIERTFALETTIQKISIPAACLSSVCVDPAYRGQGLSRKLHDFVISELNNRGIGLSYLIARRAVDHYYSRFGFVGISSYESIQINGPSNLLCPVEPGTYTCNKLDSSASDETLATLSDLYNLSYQSAWGRCLRTPAIWRSLLQRMPLLENTELFTINNDKQIVAYFIKAGASIAEIGLTNATNASDARKIISKISDHTELSQFDLPHAHSAIASLNNDDIIYKRRSCVYGGHMVRVINRDSLQSVRSQLSLNTIPKSVHDRLPVADQACYLLGILPPWPTKYDAHSAFNLSFPEVL